MSVLAALIYAALAALAVAVAGLALWYESGRAWVTAWSGSGMLAPRKVRVNGDKLTWKWGVPKPIKVQLDGNHVRTDRARLFPRQSWLVDVDEGRSMIPTGSGEFLRVDGRKLELAEKGSAFEAWHESITGHKQAMIYLLMGVVLINALVIGWAIWQWGGA